MGTQTAKSTWRLPIHIPAAWALLCASIFTSGKSYTNSDDAIEVARKFREYLDDNLDG